MDSGLQLRCRPADALDLNLFLWNLAIGPSHVDLISMPGEPQFC